MSLDENVTNDKSAAKIFYLKAAVLILAVCAAALLCLCWSLCRRVSPLAAMSRLRTPEANEFEAVKKNAELRKLTLMQITEGMYLLGGDPAVLLSAEQSRKAAAVMPLVRQFIDRGEAEADTSEKASEQENLDSIPVMMKYHLWNILTEAQKSAVLEFEHKGRLTSSAKEVLAFLPEFYEAICLEGGLSDEFSDSGMSPIRRRLDKLRMIHWLTGVILLDSESDYAVSKEQAELFKPMIKPLMAAENRAPGVRASNYYPIMETQVRAVLSDKQQARLMKILWDRSILDMNLESSIIFSQFEKLINKRISGEIYSILPEELLRSNNDKNEGESITVAIKSDIRFLQVLHGIIFVLENSEELRLSNEQIASLNAVLPEVKGCLENIKNGRRDEQMPKLQAKLLSFLSDAQITEIKNNLASSGTDSVPEELAADELDNFMSARLSHKRYKYVKQD